MKRIISTILLVSLLLSTVLFMTSCDEDDGAQINVFLSEQIYNFDPAGSYLDDATIAILHLIYEPLFNLDEDGDVQEAMADEYEFDDETGDLIITLCESYWSNGKLVTAQHFVNSWQRIIDYNNSFDCAPLLYEIKNARYIKTGTVNPETGKYCYTDDLGVVAVDNMTLRISFEDSENVDRDAFLRNLTNIALAPINRDSLNNSQTEYWYLTNNMTGYCNGPFRIQELNLEEGYFTLARNADYHRPEDSEDGPDEYVIPAELRTIWDINYKIDDVAAKDPKYLHEVYSRMYKEAEEKAERTVFYMSALSLDDRKTVGDSAVVSDALSTYTYIFNTRNPLFADSNVRSVLSRVIDRNKLVEIVTFAKPATGFISPGVWDTDDADEDESFRAVGGSYNALTKPLSIEEANKLLGDAPRGTFSISFENREEDKAIAEYVAGLWGQLGYTVTLKPCTAVVKKEYPKADPQKPTTVPEEDLTTYYDSTLKVRYDTRDFDVIAVDYQMFSTNAFTALATLSGNYHGGKIDMDAYNKVPSADTENKVLSKYRTDNVAGYQNEQYDALIAKAIATSDLEERSAILHEAEELLMCEMPVAPLLFNQNFYVVHDYLDNLEVNYYGFTVFTYATLKDYEEFFFQD